MTDNVEFDWKEQLDTLFNVGMVKWPIYKIRQVLSRVHKDDVANYAKELYQDSLRNECKDGLLKSVAIIDITGRIENFDFSQISRSLLDKIKECFLAIHLSVGVPDDACYSDKKQVKLLETAATNNDSFEIFSRIEPFLDSFNYAIISDSIVGVCAKFLWLTDKDFVIDYLRENEWSFKMELVLQSLRSEFDEIIPQVIDGRNQYPYLYMIKFLVADLDNGLKGGLYRLDQLPDYSDLFGGFISCYAQALDRIRIPFRLAISVSFNYFVGWACSNNRETLKNYLSFLTEVQENAQKAFADGYIIHRKTQNLTDDSWMILNSWVSNCIKSYSRANQYCGFINLFIAGLAFNFSTKVEYQNKLKSLLDEIDELQYSWGERNYPAKINVALYFILANKKKCFSFDETEIKEHFPILLDRRYELIIGKNLLISMLNLLKDPEHVEQIVLVDSSGNDKIWDL